MSNSAPPAPALLALLDRLEAVAQKAQVVERIPPTGWWYSRGRLASQYGLHTADAAFIAACSPETILALLTAARRGAETRQQQEQDQG